MSLIRSKLKKEINILLLLLYAHECRKTVKLYIAEMRKRSSLLYYSIL